MSGRPATACQVTGRSTDKLRANPRKSWWNNVVDIVTNGVTEAMLARYSQTPIDYAIRAVVDAWAGKKVPHYTGDDGHALEPGRDPNSASFLVTKENAANYKPEND